MRINVSEAYREEFEVFISEYQQFCDRVIDLVVETVSIDELITYCRHKHPDVLRRLTDPVSSSDTMIGIIEKCIVTNITPLGEVMQHFHIIEGNKMIVDYQRSLDKYLLKLRARYLLGSSKDIVNAETIIFILDCTPDEASFSSIRHLLYKAFHYLNKNVIVQDTGKINFAFIYVS